MAQSMAYHVGKGGRGGGDGGEQVDVWGGDGDHLIGGDVHNIYKWYAIFWINLDRCGGFWMINMHVCNVLLSTCYLLNLNHLDDWWYAMQ
jgi:hypothetical protein